jgi:hypothetical protein
MKFYELKRRKPSREKDAAGATVPTEEIAGGGVGMDGGIGMAGGVGMDGGDCCGGEESASGRGLEAGSGGAGDGGDSEFDDGESGNYQAPDSQA